MTATIDLKALVRSKYGQAALAEQNRVQSGLANVEFLKGEIEHIPLPDNAVDVIISNCVVNLSSDDARAFLTSAGIAADAIAREVDGKFVSAFVRAVKPLA